MVYLASDALVTLVTIILICLIIILPIRWIVKSIARTTSEGILNAKKKKFEKDIQEYMQDYEDGYLTNEDIDEIVKDYNSRDKNISVYSVKCYDAKSDKIKVERISCDII